MSINMKIRKKIVLKIVPAAVITFALVILLYKLDFPWIYIDNSVAMLKVQRSRVRLLCQTNHKALLEACRKLSRQLAAGELSRRLAAGEISRILEAEEDPNEDCYRIWIRNSKELSWLPKPILDLDPDKIYINEDGRVVLSVSFGRLGDFGLYAYPEDYKKPFERFQYGDRELIDGLWYYDQGYVHNPGYDKRIEALLRKKK
jgi:hypothetical protein